jgi:hypothetical protein
MWLGGKITATLSKLWNCKGRMWRMAEGQKSDTEEDDGKEERTSRSGDVAKGSDDRETKVKTAQTSSIVLIIIQPFLTPRGGAGLGNRTQYTLLILSF